MATEKSDPNEILHLQVAEGETVKFQGRAYGDRGTLQVRRGDLGAVEGKYVELASGDDVPDVAEPGARPAR